jgi:hypothetical protein
MSIRVEILSLMGEIVSKLSLVFQERKLEQYLKPAQKKHVREP